MPSVYAAKMKQRHNKMIEEGKIKIKEEPVHKKTEEEVLEAINKTVSHARNLCENIEWSCEDEEDQN